MISGDSNFHIGDKVVYPNHGVGVIEQISSRTIGETVEKFYLLKIKANSLKVMVPFHNVNTVGLRRVVKNGEIQKIVDFLTDGECDNNADWKYRFKENSERMRTGSLLEVSAVLKGLLLLNHAAIGFSDFIKAFKVLAKASTKPNSLLVSVSLPYLSPSAMSNWVSTSRSEPLAWCKKSTSSLSDERSLPSAILLETETAARRNGLVRPYLSSRGKLSVWR